MSQSPPEPPSGWLSFAKGLSIGNSAAILVLLLGLVPAYVVYRLVTDEQLLDRFLSAYSIEQTTTPCRLIKARERGEHYTWATATGFAYEGQQRWTIGVVSNREPTPEEQNTDCLLLQAIIGFMHGENEAPGIIWQEKDAQGREGMKGDR